MPQINLENSSAHTPEIQDIISAPPSWILRWGIMLFFTVLVLIVSLSALIRYPDIVKTQLVINSSDTPQPVVSPVSGMLVRLVANEGQQVKDGQALAYLESSARHEDVLQVLEQLKRLQSAQRGQSLKAAFSSTDLQLGELEEEYKTFYDAFFLNGSLNIPASKQATFEQRLSKLISKGERWKTKYILTSPGSGRLSSSRIIHENQMVKAGEEIYYVKSDNDEFFGEMAISEHSIGKVKAGQEVLIKLKAFPYEEYGLIKGKIGYITEMSDKANNFLSKVSISKQGLSDLKEGVKLKEGMTAEAEIVTQNASLFSRITRNLFKIIYR